MFSGLGRTVLLVADLDEALAFYQDVLDFAVLHDETVDGHRYLHVGVPGQDGTGLWFMPSSDQDLVGRQAGQAPFLVLYADDLDAVRARLAAHGINTWAERDEPGSRSLHFRDLYGNTLVAVQLTA